MRIVLALAGCAVMAAAVGDLVKTTLALRHGGFYTIPLARVLWFGLLRARPSHRVLDWVGPVAVLLMVAMWVVPLWLGATLVFMGSEGAVLHGQTRMPADAAERAYYAGFSLITLGTGDFVAGDDVWRLVTILMSGLGFFFVTLIITYLIPLLEAVVAKRELAMRISAIGTTPAEILRCARGAEDPEGAAEWLAGFGEDIARLSQVQLAYPAMHFFHVPDRDRALAPALASLDEAMTVLRVARCGDGSRASRRLGQAARIIDGFLEHLGAFRGDAGVPPAPELAGLLPRRDGPTQAAFEESLAADGERRARLNGYVRADGWNWEDVTRGEAAGGTAGPEGQAAAEGDASRPGDGA